ncbi:hypothetical protein ACOME3_003000 [Neoechinorhynchus agilis]
MTTSFLSSDHTTTHPVTYLAELGTLFSTIPTYVVTDSHPRQCPIYTVRAQFCGLEKSASSSNKKQAKFLAANALLISLSVDQSPLLASLRNAQFSGDLMAKVKLKLNQYAELATAFSDMNHVSIQNPIEELYLLMRMANKDVKRKRSFDVYNDETSC